MSADGTFAPEIIKTDEAEYALLCALLTNNAHFEVCADLKAADFSDGGYGLLFEAIADKVRAGHMAAPSTLQVWAKAHGVPFEALVNMHQSGNIRGVKLSDQVAVIRQASASRSLVSLLEKTLQKVKAMPHLDAGEQIVALERKLGDLARSSGDKDQFKALHEVMDRAIAQAKSGSIKGLSTGLASLDELTGGLARGHFWAIGGYAKQGKSTISQSIGYSVACQGQAVLRFDFEMTEEDVGLRYATSIAYNPNRPRYGDHSGNPTYIDARKGALTGEQWGMLEDAAQVAQDLPIYILTERGLTVAQMQARARRKIRDLERQGVQTGAIIVDHTLLVRSEADRRGNKAAEAGDVADEITAMAKTLNVAVVGLCQLNRASADLDKRPTKNMLAWSANIERNANVIALLHRPASKLEAKEKLNFEEAEEQTRIKDHLIIYVDGNRNGPNGEVYCRTDMGSAVLRDAPELKGEYKK